MTNLLNSAKGGIQVSVQPNALVGKYALNQRVPYQMDLEPYTSPL